MPGRLIPLVTNEIYHVLNRGIDERPTFTDKREYQRALLGLAFYQYSQPPIRLSQFLSLPNEEKEQIGKFMRKDEGKLIEILTFCLMPNHFHLLLRQKVDGGISRFMSQFQNSYTRYFNTKRERLGSLFLNQFKAVRISTDEQLLHVSRYIHLNPHSSFLIKDLEDLITYPWSSLREYLNSSSSTFCEKTTISSYFKKPESYINFIFSQADYQRELEKIKHLTLEHR